MSCYFVKCSSQITVVGHASMYYLNGLESRWWTVVLIKFRLDGEWQRMGITALNSAEWLDYTILNSDINTNVRCKLH